ncbi:MAG: leucine-rich repeat domain-containing protein, partial [Bacilli bacterium]
NTGKATVKVTGKGKFEGYTCNGDSINMECVKGEIPGSTETAAQYFSYSEVEGGVSITGYNIEGGTDVVIPSEIDGKKVVEIADNAFTSAGVTPTTISNTKKVSVSYLNNNKKDVAAIPLIGIPLPDGLGITSVVIPSTVKSIGNRAFVNNQITEVVIPSSVTSIGKDAFSNNQLVSLTISGSVGASAFRNNKLTTLTLLDGVVSIDLGAFSDNQLTEVIIPSSVTSIGRGAFFKSGSSNQNLSKIINKTGKSFEWGDIISYDSRYGFITGTVPNSYGNVEVVSE